MRTSTLERAFELARAGAYGRVEHLRRVLVAEGYLDAERALAPEEVRAQLRHVRRRARSASALR